MVKVRFTTWYWGNYCLATNAQAKALPTGFEIYNEEAHGWNNSEEFKLYKKKQYQTGDHGTLEQFLNCSYYQSWKIKQEKQHGMA